MGVTKKKNIEMAAIADASEAAEEWLRSLVETMETIRVRASRMKIEVVGGATQGKTLSDKLKQEMNETAYREFKNLKDGMEKELDTITKQIQGRTGLIQNRLNGEVSRTRKNADVLDVGVVKEETDNVEMRTKLTERIVQGATATKAFDDKSRRAHAALVGRANLTGLVLGCIETKFCK